MASLLLFADNILTIRGQCHVGDLGAHGELPLKGFG